MRYVAAYLLASLGGNENPSAADLEKIIGSVGIEVEADKVKKIISELKGKSLEELVAAGTTKLASVPSGGGAAAAGASAAAAPAAAKEEKKEEKKEESEESDDDMGFGLFD
ncbi:60S acidic ribosomal protein P2-like [Mizuhopecten yessoensis]|uniref:Large ribosomal subunit protein P2 n=1 Tax=Mizuhopecten yessoensis TaxID=6573 RepID=A0A210Q0V0_MIZYE|nr:60S acidic ribosomal protein P2-like [Mizuhopecten yessoensis]OWF42384.1 60S acidic ribosomal protein P2 [Mizuhopecten yessoensis]